ncbi:RICIN domain-containing protein [Gynuella sp.]|uniref:RICIN domain-containing protein n=1 Tax=Gynuella sp. TaxID=2969146 RepID=UPI003D13D319
MKKCISGMLRQVVGLSVLNIALVSTVQAAELDDGVVSPIVGVNAGLCLGVKYSSNSAGATLQSQTCNGSNYQKWQMSKDAAKYFTIKNVGSGLCLDVTGWSSSEGTVLQQWTCSGADVQKWNVSDQGGGQYAVISKHSNLAMDVYGGRKTDGTDIIQWSWNGADNQKWKFPNATSGGSGSSGGPVGFGSGVTGGAGGEVVTVSTPGQLKSALSGNTPRIIRVSGSIDFRNTEGKTTELGCTYSENSCNYNGKQEKILNVGSYCSGRSLYNITYDKAGKLPLTVGSNKTIIGVGAYSGIKGKGLRMVSGVSNIIIRNLSITDINDGIIWGGDAITIDNASKIWIDHNYIARIGRQFIVTGWGTAQNVTISGNYLDGTTDYGHYCNRRHYWNALLLGENQSITMVGNRFHMTSGRSPKFSKQSSANSAGILHMVNNYFDQNYGVGFDGDYAGTVLMEGNYYERGNNFRPIDSGSTGTPLFAPLDSSIGSANNTCRSVLGRNCQSNYDTNSQGNFVINSSAMSNIQRNGSWLNAVKSVSPKSYSAVKSQSFGPQSNITY